MDLNTIIKEAENIPATPQILPKLQSVLRDENSQIDDIIKVVKVDASLTAQLLKISNSAFYGGVTPAKNLNEAVNRLGYQEIYKVVGTAVGQQALGGGVKAYDLKPGELWDSSIVSAVMMEQGAKHFRFCSDTAYTVGLLHAIGKLIINDYYLKTGIEVYNEAEGDSLEPEMERQILGFDHAEAGSALLESWEFSDKVYTPIHDHLTPLEAAVHKEMTCMIHLASWTSKWLKADSEISEKDISEKMSVIEAIGFSEDDFKELLHGAQQNLEEVQASLAV